MKKTLSAVLCALVAVSSVGAYASDSFAYTDKTEIITYDWEELVPDSPMDEEVSLEEAEFDVDILEDMQLQATVSTPSVSFTNVLEGVQVDITCSTSGTTIYYTTDGTTPTTDSEVYDAENRPVLDEAGSYSIKAIAYKSGSKSSVASKSKTVYDCGIDVLNDSEILEVRSFKDTSTGKIAYLKVSLNGITSDYKVFYTTGISNIPTTSSTQWKDEIKIDKPTRINFRIYRSGYAPSAVASQNITHSSWSSMETVQKPTITHVKGYGYVRLKFTNQTEGATIRYAISNDQKKLGTLTLDRTVEYTEPVKIDTEGTYYYKVYAVKDGYYDSEESGVATLKMEKTTAPTVSVSGSASSKTRTVTISKGATDDRVFYTTNGTEPSITNGTEYTEKVSFDKSVVFKAVSVRVGCLYSDVKEKEIVINNETPTVDVVSAPKNSLASTASNGAKTVQITCATSGAKIYYKLQPYSEDSMGYVPTTDDTLYTAPITISESGEYALSSRAYLGGKYSQTTVNKITVTITQSDITQLDPPTAKATTLSNGVKAVYLSSIDGSKIYYTVLDGKVTDKTAIQNAVITEDDAHLYTYPITITKDSTVIRYAVYENASGNRVQSERTSNSVGISGGPLEADKVAEVTMSTRDEAEGTGIYLACADSEADIFYKFDTDASAYATTADTAYTRGMPIISPNTGYLHVIAAKPGYEFTTQTFSLDVNRAAAPEITFSQYQGNSYIATFTSKTPNATFYYTTDGTDPTTSGNVAENGLAFVSKGSTIKAIAVAPGYGNSSITERIVGEDEQQCDIVTVDVSDVMGGKSVILNTMTDGADIYYTTDSTNPSTSGVLYTGSFNLTQAGEITVKAVAKKSGYTNSEVAQKVVTVEAASNVKGKIRYANDGVYITLYAEKTIEGGVIYYTLDGTVPNTDSNVYAGEIHITKECKLNAIVIAPGYAAGEILTSTITPPDENTVKIPEVKSRWCIGGREYLFTCETDGASIYYAFGSDPAESDYVLYDSENPPKFTLENGKVKVYAAKEGMKTSRVSTFTAVNIYRAQMPTADVATNSLVAKGTKVSLITPEIENQALSGSNTGTVKTVGTIFYTLDGSEPTLNSAVYTEPIAINETTLIRAAVADMGYRLSEIASFYYMTEEDLVGVDTSGLTRTNNLIEGSVKVDCSKVSAESGKIVAAIYSDGKMLQAVSVDFAKEVTLSGFEVVAGGSVNVKVFVLENIQSLSPICESTTAVF